MVEESGCCDLTNSAAIYPIIIAGYKQPYTIFAPTATPS